MSIELKIRKNEPIDRALRRMKKKLDRENIIKGTRAKRYYEKPCERRRRKDKVMAFTAMLRRRFFRRGPNHFAPRLFINPAPL
jgi:small subunit ribosomal protein S21